MKVIITFTFCCDNLWKSIVCGFGKSPENSGNFFLLLCGHLVTCSTINIVPNISIINTQNSSDILIIHAVFTEPEPSNKRVWPTVVPAQCRMTSLLCRSGRHLSAQVHRSDRLFLWKLLTPIYILQPNLLSTLTITT